MALDFLLSVSNKKIEQTLYLSGVIVVIFFSLHIEHFFLGFPNSIFSNFFFSILALVFRTQVKRTWHKSQQKRKIDWIYSFVLFHLNAILSRSLSETASLSFKTQSKPFILHKISCQGFMHDFVDFCQSHSLRRLALSLWYKHFSIHDAEKKTNRHRI